MVAGNWFNNDGLFIEFGTSKPVVTDVGDYLAYGQTRCIEIGIDLTTLTTTPAILSPTTFFPPAGGTSGANSNPWIIERVETTVEVGATTGTAATLKVGLIQDDRATTPANYAQAFINAETTAQMATAGDLLEYVGADSLPAGSTKGGILIGTTAAAATGPYYITASTGAGTFTAGKVRVRIFYRGTGVITK